MNSLKKILLTSMSVALLFGCGGSGNNEQGVSFTLLGFYQPPAGSTSSSVGSLVGDAGRIVSVSIFKGNTGISVASQQTTYLGLSNNLTGQTIRTTKINYSYEIPGSSLSIPDAVQFVSFILTPVSNGTGVGSTGATTDLPDPAINQGKAGPTNFPQVVIFPPNVASWFNSNVASLPTGPFEIILTVTVEGITSSGSGLTTNPEYYTLDVFPRAGSGSSGSLGGGSGGSASTTTTTVTVTSSTTTTT